MWFHGFGVLCEIRSLVLTTAKTSFFYVSFGTQYPAYIFSFYWSKRVPNISFKSMYPKGFAVLQNSHKNLQ